MRRRYDFLRYAASITFRLGGVRLPVERDHLIEIERQHLRLGLPGES
jgi:hypothetical protein